MSSFNGFKFLNLSFHMDICSLSMQNVTLRSENRNNVILIQYKKFLWKDCSLTNQFMYKSLKNFNLPLPIFSKKKQQQKKSDLCFIFSFNLNSSMKKEQNLSNE